MKIEELTLGQIKELTNIAKAFGGSCSEAGLNDHVGEKVIIRTYSAGVWFGTLAKKSGDEVVLENARRMWQWWAKKSISLSAVAKYGVKQDSSKIAPAVSKQWLKAIEIISLTDTAIESIEGCEDAEAR